jgi:hypothetical protein
MALHRRPRAIAVALLVLQLLGGLAPFDFGVTRQVFHWLPFEALLGGTMLGNAQVLARDAWLWGAALCFAWRGGESLPAWTLACAAAAAAVEGVQCWMPSRAADITPPLIVLGLGWLASRYAVLFESSGLRR